MKTWNIEIQKVKAMANSNGLIRAQIDAIVQPAAARDEGVPSTVISLSEENARVLLLLLKAQLAEFDSRKAKSRR
jgi:tRNA A37 threonylcarbamoyladenosine synthetase subunit TsaC/SUA5/YrdC